MHRSKLFKTAGAMVALVAMLQPLAALANPWAQLTIAPRSGAMVGQYVRDAGSVSFLNHAEKLALLQKKVKYVFVLFQENRSFDHYFGTYPGAYGLFPPGTTATNLPTNATIPGFVQKIVNTDGSVSTISPFLIPQTVKGVSATGGAATVNLYPADTT